MLGTEPLVIYVVGAILVGVAMDWAVFERVKITLGAFDDHDEVEYRDLPNWRVRLVVLASAIIGASLSTPTLDALPLWVGISLFVALNIYGDYLALRR